MNKLQENLFQLPICKPGNSESRVHLDSQLHGSSWRRRPAGNSHTLGPVRLSEPSKALQYILAFVGVFRCRLEARIVARAIFFGIYVEEAWRRFHSVVDFRFVRKKSGVDLWDWRCIHAHPVGKLVDLALLAILAGSSLVAVRRGIDLESGLAWGIGTLIHYWGGNSAVDQKSERKDDLSKS